jgi:coenzyme PQQ precursor peptide PqqA
MFRAVDLQGRWTQPAQRGVRAARRRKGAPRGGPIGWRGTASGVIDKSYSLDFLNPEAARVGCGLRMILTQERKKSMAWTTPTLVEICIGLEINGYLPAEF